MRPVLRSIACVFGGFVAASLVMMAVESFNGQVLYPDLARAAAGATDREAIRRIFASAPTGALLVVVAGWGLGGAVGGWFAARLAPGRRFVHGCVLAAILLVAGIANNLMLPPPAWFWVASLGATALGTLLGTGAGARSGT